MFIKLCPSRLRCTPDILDSVMAAVDSGDLDGGAMQGGDVDAEAQHLEALRRYSDLQALHPLRRSRAGGRHGADEGR